MGSISTADPIGAAPAVLATTTVVNPDFTGIYWFSAADLAGVVASNVFVSLFNPLGSGKDIIVLGGSVGCYIAAGSAGVNESLLIKRVTAASAGVLEPASAIGKGITAYPASIAEVRTGNPTVTLGAQFTSVPPPVSGNSLLRVTLQVIEAAAPLLLAPGEGLVAMTEAGDTDHRWNIHVQWAEML